MRRPGGRDLNVRRRGQAVLETLCQQLHLCDHRVELRHVKHRKRRHYRHDLIACSLRRVPLEQLHCSGRVEDSEVTDGVNVGEELQPFSERRLQSSFLQPAHEAVVDKVGEGYHSLLLLAARLPNLEEISHEVEILFRHAPIILKVNCSPEMIGACCRALAEHLGVSSSHGRGQVLCLPLQMNLGHSIYGLAHILKAFFDMCLLGEVEVVGLLYSNCEMELEHHL
mmetsp:Transcript_19435/g.64375  ORF Transcript_19435/g.64375 Transcript_19435/m.64375 type:complete len:225 (+) Transcript_19435:365-1039(+)